ncbi:MAG: insulinase family protein [Oscillospiraceae bacterium]|nr:insulinase family protein [Oscillospiraceae bacterium]
MEVTRTELLPGVFLTHLQTDKFKTACLSVNLLTQLSRETASMNALIPAVLRRGTTRWRDMEQLSRRLDELYGTAIEPVIRRIGEIHCLGFFASFPEPAYLPGGENLLGEVCDLTAQLLLSPNTRGGLLLPQYVDSEKEKLADLIRSRVNDKRSYALQRCIEEMCCYEDFAVSRFGSLEECESIHYKKLTKHYRELVRSCPMEIFYCGRSANRTVCAALREAFGGMPRGEINWDIGTDLRMNAVEDQVRYVEERMDVSQGKLVMGFRLGECMEDPDRAALHVFNAVFGSGATSKLFLNVREKLSLCYYASSAIVLRKGLMLVSSGVAFENFEKARDEIFAQLEAVKKGEISDEEMTWARRAVASDLRAAMDSQGDLEGFWLSQALDGLDYGPLELAELVGEVTKEDVMAVANSLECDLIYFLRGEDEAADPASEEEDDAEN